MFNLKQEIPTPEGWGRKMTTKETYFQIISSNKRERTITFKEVYSDGTSTKYRTLPLDRETWNYYTNFATSGDWRAFLKTDEYYIVKR